MTKPYLTLTEAVAQRIALEELSKWPDLAMVQFKGEFNVDGTVKTYALPPEKLTGVFEALRKHQAECEPTARECVEWWYQREAIEAELRDLRMYKEHCMPPEHVCSPYPPKYGGVWFD
ncbi:MAG: hypothetical protein KOO63_03040 [Bacteroidales bacterium]|nr:hypothetical protein [Candidatus Latescibacterota bacterium]